MKRFERRRVERLRRTVLVVGLSFGLGALLDAGLTWRLHESGIGTTETARAETVRGSTATVAAAPAPVPVATSGVARSNVEKISVPRGGEIDSLRLRALEMPVDGIKRSALHDSFTDARALGRPHDAIDIMAPKGTPVRAVEDGKIAKLFTSIAGGLTVYQFDPSETFAYYYAHLDSYSHDIREGEPVQRGQVIGYVGTTGNAPENAPHLHFAIFRLTDEHKWWKGDAINPYPVLK